MRLCDLPSLLYHSYLVCIHVLFGMPSLHPFTFSKSCEYSFTIVQLHVYKATQCSLFNSVTPADIHIYVHTKEHVYLFFCAIITVYVFEVNIHTRVEDGMCVMLIV